MGDLQKKMQDLSDNYQKLQGGNDVLRKPCLCGVANVDVELSTAVEARQKLESQQQENTTVQNVRFPWR